MGNENGRNPPAPAGPKPAPPPNPPGERKCRCGLRFGYDGYSKPLCPSCMRKYRERRAREASFPKGHCGATLGLQTQRDGHTACGRCRSADREARRQRALADFADLMDWGW